jgi:hypothetical protein
MTPDEAASQSIPKALAAFSQVPLRRSPLRTIDEG